MTWQSSEDAKKTDGTSLIPSIVVSYITTSLAQFFFAKMQTNNELIVPIFSTAVSVAGAVLVSLLWRSKWFGTVFKNITGTTVHKSLWDDVLVDKVAKRVRIYTAFNYRNAYIEGTVKYYEVDEAGDCRIAIDKCIVKYKYDDRNEYRPDGLIVFKTNDVQIVEIA